jgi:excisionase family DNA binding protein
VDDILTLKEGAQYLKVSQQVLRHLIRTNQIPAKRVGRQWRLLKQSLDKYIQAEEPINN